MDIGCYTGIPDTLPEAQALIVQLMNQQAEDSQALTQSVQAANMGVAMVQAARKALNAVEAGSLDDVRVKDAMIHYLARQVAGFQLPDNAPAVVAVVREAWEKCR